VLAPAEENGAPRATYDTKMLTRGDDLVLGRPMLVPGQGTNRRAPQTGASRPG
jgi:hypothetical protein